MLRISGVHVWCVHTSVHACAHVPMPEKDVMCLFMTLYFVPLRQGLLLNLELKFSR